LFTTKLVESIHSSDFTFVQVDDPKVVIDREVPARVNLARHSLSKYKYPQQMRTPQFDTENELGNWF
jgi:hypothetical protein